jgi:hypothetical protein
MPLREAHRTRRRPRTHTGAHQFCQLYGLRDTRGRTQLADLDARVASGQQLLCDLARVRLVEAINARRHVSGNLQCARLSLLRLHVEHDEGRRGRGSNRLSIGFLDRSQRVRERFRLCIPFGEAAHQCRHVVRGMRLDEPIIAARDDQHWRAGIVGLVNGHRCVLQADGPMQHCAHRPSLGLAIAIGHVHGGLFMQCGDELRHHIGRRAVVDDGFLDALEARAGVAGDEFDAEIPEDLRLQV